MNVRQLDTVVIEDDPVQVQLLRNFTARIPELGPVVFFSDPMLAMEAIMTSGKKVDLLILDVGLPGISGFELMERLPSEPRIIIITADPVHALEGFERGVVDLLVKPFTLERLLRSVRRAASRSRAAAQTPMAPPGTEERSAVLSLRSGRRKLRIPASTIHMAEALGNYVKLHLNDRIMVVNHTFTGIQELLPQDRFVRVHRSYIVALGSIRDFHQDTLFTDNGEVPVGALYRKALMDRLEGHLKGRG